MAAQQQHVPVVNQDVKQHQEGFGSDGSGWTVK